MLRTPFTRDTRTLSEIATARGDLEFMGFGDAGVYARVRFVGTGWQVTWTGRDGVPGNLLVTSDVRAVRAAKRITEFGCPYPFVRPVTSKTLRNLPAIGA